MDERMNLYDTVLLELYRAARTVSPHAFRMPPWRSCIR